MILLDGFWRTDRRNFERIFREPMNLEEESRSVTNKLQESSVYGHEGLSRECPGVCCASNLLETNV